MNNDIQSIAKRLFELRTFSDYSTAEMASLLGIDEKTYAEYENAQDEIPINLIYKFASILDTEALYVISGKMPTKEDVAVVYGGNGMSVKRYEGYGFAELAAEFKGKTMNPMLVTIAPTDEPELVVHGGQEFNYVLEGELRVVVGGREHFLRAGDSIYFNPSLPHAQIAMNDQPAKFLTIINE